MNFPIAPRCRGPVVASAGFLCWTGEQRPFRWSHRSSGYYAKRFLSICQLGVPGAFCTSFNERNWYKKRPALHTTSPTKYPTQNQVTTTSGRGTTPRRWADSCQPMMTSMQTESIRKRGIFIPMSKTIHSAAPIQMVMIGRKSARSDFKANHIRHLRRLYAGCIGIPPTRIEPSEFALKCKLAVKAKV